MKNIARFDNGQILGKTKITPEGYIKGEAIVTRTGIFNYQNFDGSIRKELRHPDDIWVLDSIKTMEMIPITNNHPLERLVTAENYKNLSIGYTGETVTKTGDYISTNIIITDKDGIEAVKNGRRQLSLGYLVDLVEESGDYKGERYDARQTNIRYNHLAIVDKARAGDQACIKLDSYDAVEILNIEENMTKRKVKIDEDEVFMNESEANFIDKLQMDLKNLQDERNRVEAELADIRERLEKAESERDSMRDTISVTETMPNMDSIKFQKAVIDRTNILKIALDSVSADTFKKIDSLSDFEIKKEIIKASKKTVSLDGKSQVYIDCMYDLILSEKNEKNVKLDTVQHGKKNDHSENPVLDARNKMIERSKNQINKTSGVK